MSGTTQRQLFLLLVMGVGIGATAPLLSSCAEATQPGPDVLSPDHQDISDPLRDLVKLAPDEREDVDRDRDREAEPWRQIPHNSAFVQHQPDPVVQLAPGSAQIAAT